MMLRIYRTWSWKLAIPMSEVRYGGSNPMRLVPCDELQFGSYVPGTEEIVWAPVEIVEAPKPESPSARRNREISQSIARGIAEIEMGIKHVKNTE